MWSESTIDTRTTLVSCVPDTRCWIFLCSLYLLTILVKCHATCCVSCCMLPTGGVARLRGWQKVVPARHAGLSRDSAARPQQAPAALPARAAGESRIFRCSEVVLRKTVPAGEPSPTLCVGGVGRSVQQRPMFPLRFRFGPPGVLRVPVPWRPAVDISAIMECVASSTDMECTSLE